MHGKFMVNFVECFSSHSALCYKHFDMSVSKLINNKMEVAWFVGVSKMTWSPSFYEEKSRPRNPLPQKNPYILMCIYFCMIFHTFFFSTASFSPLKAHAHVDWQSSRTNISSQQHVFNNPLTSLLLLLPWLATKRLHSYPSGWCMCCV